VALDEKGRPPFQLLQALEMNQERPPIVMYAFDLLQLSLMARTFEIYRSNNERRSWKRCLVSFSRLRAATLPPVE
jgi:hypothetical protein